LVRSTPDVLVGPMTTQALALKQAHDLLIDVPQSLLLRADEVLQ